MQHATAETVRGDFNDAKFTFDGVTSSFFRRDGKFFVRTDGPDGKLADFEVKYTFGLEPLQQYLVELPGGRLQALAVTWDTRPKDAGRPALVPPVPGREARLPRRTALDAAFAELELHVRGLPLEPGDEGLRRRAETRSTRARRRLPLAARHVTGRAPRTSSWAKEKSPDPRKGLTAQLDERRGVTWSIDAATGNAKRSRERTGEREIEVCAQCHARRAQIAEGYHAGKPFLDHYLPSLLVAPLYWSDGQQRDEVFIWGSWLQSRMHRQGVTCSDCHDPHTQKLRVEGNAVCGQCHAPGKYDAPAHHRHTAGTAGAQCAECHMPRTTYMVVDGRRDHSMRVPRPDQSIALGVPNACNQCHTKQDAQWAAAAVRGWLGRDATGFQAFAPTFRAAEAGQAGATASLATIANDLAHAPIVRASAVERLAQAGSGDASTAQRAARDAQPLLRLASVQLIELLPPQEQLRLLAPLFSDPLRAVRIEAARAAAGQQDSLAPERRAAWQQAADEYIATLRYTADQPEAPTALGTFYSRLGRHDEAQSGICTGTCARPAPCAGVSERRRRVACAGQRCRRTPDARTGAGAGTAERSPAPCPRPDAGAAGRAEGSSA